MRELGSGLIARIFSRAGETPAVPGENKEWKCMSESRAVENETLGPRASRPPVKKCGQDARFQTPRFSYVNNVAGRTLTVGWRKQKQEKDVNGYKRCLMNKQVSFTVLGSYSGRNAGDAAILASLMKTLTDEFGEQTRFEVPTQTQDSSIANTARSLKSKAYP